MNAVEFSTIAPIEVGLAILSDLRSDPKRRVTITNWIFNGWAKYDNWRDDNQIPAFIAKRDQDPSG